MENEHGRGASTLSGEGYFYVEWGEEHLLIGRRTKKHSVESGEHNFFQIERCSDSIGQLTHAKMRTVSFVANKPMRCDYDLDF